MHLQSNLQFSGVTIGPADPALQGGAVLGGRKIARKCGTFFGKLNCSTSKSTRFKLEMYVFLDFDRHFHYFAGIWFQRKYFIKLSLGATGGAKWATGAPAGGRPYPTLRRWSFCFINRNFKLINYICRIKYMSIIDYKAKTLSINHIIVESERLNWNLKFSSIRLILSEII